MKNTSFAPVMCPLNGTRTLNLAANCLDRHLQENARSYRHHLGRRRRQPDKHISYKELHRDVCRFANTLLELGIKR